MSRRARPAVASITGWIIEATDTLDRAGAAVIVTALNVIEGSRLIRVREPGNVQAFDATVVQTDPDRNLAFLEVKDIIARPIPLTRSAPSLGGPVFAAGFNAAADESEQATASTATIKGGRLGREYRGPVSREARADVNQLEHDAAMIPGFEGGPLIDQCAGWSAST